MNANNVFINMITQIKGQITQILTRIHTNKNRINTNSFIRAYSRKIRVYSYQNNLWNLFFNLRNHNILFFTNFYNLKQGKKGQAAPFLIIVLVILLIASMALVNVGKVSTHRIKTSNAADAAALAAASVLASTENTIAARNKALMKTYAILQGYFGAPKSTSQEPTQHNIFVGYMVFLVYEYLNLLYSGAKAARAAKAMAHQYAFSNVGIDEAAARDKETGKLLPSGFSEWIQDQDLRTEEVTYSWHQYSYGRYGDQTEPDAEQKKEPQQKEPQPNWVKSEVTDIPDMFYILPWPMSPLFQPYYKNISPCIDTGPHCSPCCDCWQCTADLQDFVNTLNTINGAHNSYAVERKTEWVTKVTDAGYAINMPYVGAFIEKIGGLQAFRLEMAYPTNFVECIPDETCYQQVARMMAIYWVPIPFMMAITNNEAEVEVEVTRYSPSADLGLWRFGASTVKSKARATTYGGRVFPPKVEYKAKLTEAE